MAQLCLTLCYPMDYTVHGILQARILEFPSPGVLPNPGIKPRSPTLQVDSLPIELSGKKPYITSIHLIMARDELWIDFLSTNLNF